MQKLLFVCIKAGYTGVVITDHYSREFSKQQRMTIGIKVDEYLTGYFTAFEEGKRMGLKVLLGMEIKFNEGLNEYLIYGFNPDFLYENPGYTK